MTTTTTMMMMMMKTIMTMVNSASLSPVQENTTTSVTPEGPAMHQPASTSR